MYSVDAGTECSTNATPGGSKPLSAMVMFEEPSIDLEYYLMTTDEMCAGRLLHLNLRFPDLVPSRRSQMVLASISRPIPALLKPALGWNLCLYLLPHQDALVFGNLQSDLRVVSC